MHERISTVSKALITIRTIRPVFATFMVSSFPIPRPIICENRVCYYYIIHRNENQGILSSKKSGFFKKAVDKTGEIVYNNICSLI